MRRITDQTVLLLYGLLTLFMVPLKKEMIIAFLVAVIYGAFNTYMESGKWCGFTGAIYLVGAFFCPEFLLFLPLVLYMVLWRKEYLLSGFLGALYVFCYAKESPLLFLYLLLGLFLGALIQDQTSRYEVLEQKFRRTRDDSTELNLLLEEKNQSLLKNQDYEIYTATLRERNRIAREIHDNVGHMLTRSILMVGAMRAVNRQENLKDPLEQLDGTLNAAMTSVRESVHDLHDDSINLQEVLTALTKEYAFCPVQLEYDMGYALSREIKYSFITIVKEALSNTAKHSNATKVQIVVREHPGMYQLQIEDNGESASGKAAQELGQSGGIGLTNMRDRVAALRGFLQIHTEKGFCIYITIPKEEKDETCNRG